LGGTVLTRIVGPELNDGFVKNSSKIAWRCRKNGGGGKISFWKITNCNMSGKSTRKSFYPGEIIGRTKKASRGEVAEKIGLKFFFVLHL